MLQGSAQDLLSMVTLLRNKMFQQAGGFNYFIRVLIMNVFLLLFQYLNKAKRYQKSLPTYNNRLVFNKTWTERVAVFYLIANLHPQQNNWFIFWLIVSPISSNLNVQTTHLLCDNWKEAFLYSMEAVCLKNFWLRWSTFLWILLIFNPWNYVKIGPTLITHKHYKKTSHGKKRNSACQTSKQFQNISLDILAMLPSPAYTHAK